MTLEARENAPIIALSKVLERVTAATGVSIRTLRRIKQEKNQVDNGERNEFNTPNKKRPGRNRKKTIILDDADQGILRRTIYNFHTTEKQVPTLKKNHKKFTEDTGYQGSHESVRKEMRKIGFRWKKMRNNRNILIEKHEIRHLRIEFLKKMRSYRAEERPIIYMDETYIHAGHTKLKAWSDSSHEGLRKNISKGEMLIILNAGGDNGFVPGTYARWKSTCKTGDYHDSMNYDNYEKWVTRPLIPNLPANSVVVIDNAPYHNKQQDKCPTSATTKREMQEWLRSKNIPFGNIC
jgi:transposase